MQVLAAAMHTCYLQMEPYVYLTCTYVYAQMEPYRSRAAGAGVYFIFIFFLYLYFIFYYMGAYGRRGASAATVRVPLGPKPKTLNLNPTAYT